MDAFYEMGPLKHPEPVTDDDVFSECQTSMFIFQIPRLVRITQLKF